MHLLKLLPALFAGVAALVCVPAWGQHGAPDRGRQAEAGSDISVLREYVRRDRAYSVAARARALRAVDRLAAVAGTGARFELEAARIVALADNGHSMMLPPQWTLRYKRSPVRMGLFADGLFVIAAPDPFRSLLGGRVMRINGRPWRRVHDSYAQYQGGRASFRGQFVALFMEMPALLEAAGLGQDPDRTRLDVAVAGGGSRAVTVEAVMAPLAGHHAFFGQSQLLDGVPFVVAGGAAAPLYLDEADRPFRLRFLETANAAYIQLKTTNDAGPVRIAPFLDGTLASLRTRRPANIIVDLRFNMGGDLNLARAFMQALPGLAAGGRLYAITSGRTFSAAISSLGYLKQAAGDRLTIVGEPVGDRLEFWAEGDIMRLPGPGAMMLYATERHNYMTGCPEPDCHAAIRNNPIRVRSLDPDLNTPLRFADFRAGRDPAMAAILADIRRRSGS